MTVNEAVRRLKKNINEDNEEYYRKEFVEAYYMAISALEKQNPVKPEVKPNQYKAGRNNYYCPDCGKILNNEKHCPDCGKAIDYDGFF